EPLLAPAPPEPLLAPAPPEPLLAPAPPEPDTAPAAPRDVPPGQGLADPEEAAPPKPSRMGTPEVVALVLAALVSVALLATFLRACLSG
ncbi:MAG: hypothetical protein JXB39_14775, partial [Deltaproteobacteria bacterium]|nr:hypothetical protein [Deltaproteobacteria bacterium]